MGINSKHKKCLIRGQGFTLIEVIVGIGTFVIISSFSFLYIADRFPQVSYRKEKSLALSILLQERDKLKILYSTDPKIAPDGTTHILYFKSDGSQLTSSVNAKYTLTYISSTKNVTANLPTPVGSTIIPLKKISLKVAWNDSKNTSKDLSLIMVRD